MGRLRSAKLGLVPAYRSSPELNLRLGEGLRKGEIPLSDNPTCIIRSHGASCGSTPVTWVTHWIAPRTYFSRDILSYGNRQGVHYGQHQAP
jgi:hypothetical protein